MRFIITILALLASLSSISQTNFTLSGHIQDANSGEQLIGASIYSDETKLGVAANIYGFYSLTIPTGVYTIVATYIGYTPQKFEIDLNKNLTLDIDLVPGTTLEEAVVTGEAFNKIEDQVQMSKVEIPIDQIKRIPAIGGEVDILKVLQLMPGVQSGGEGTSGLYVRGGSPDQNLMLLDGVPLYNVSHLFGFFSVFNADAVRNMSLTKGGFPARFGGRLSSILEVHMKDGNMKEYHGDATVSIISSKATIEGPIIKDKVSFMLSARRTYLDLIVNPLISAMQKNDNAQVDPRYFFYDFNAKLNWKISDKDRLYYSAFSGKDDFGIGIEEDFGESPSRIDLGLFWKNSISALRWNHIWNPKLFSNLTVSTSKYGFNTGADFRRTEESPDFPGILSEYRFRTLYLSSIEDIAAKIDFDYSPNPRHYIRYGASYINHNFLPGADSSLFTINPVSFTSGAPLPASFPDTTITVWENYGGPTQTRSNEWYVYLEDEIEVFDRLKINLGGHFSSLLVDDTTYYSFQPRLAINYNLPNGLALKASYVEMAQYVNLLSNEGVGLPTDLWVPSTGNVTPQLSTQYAIGMAKTFGDVEVTVEGYYKNMTGLLSYIEGASFILSAEDGWEDKVTQGIGNSYGYEVLVQKKKGRVTGWIGYTLSWSNRKFEEINNGDWYPFTYDRRHDISLVYNHKLTDALDLGFVFVYGTGRALTLTDVQFDTYTDDPNDVINVSVPTSKNTYRLSPYHRADISLTHTKFRDSYQRDFIISAYNLYNNINPFFALPEVDNDGNTVIREYGLFPVIPSIAFRIKF